MKKIILSLLAAVTCLSMNAQQIKVYENGVLTHTYKNNPSNTVKVVVEEGIAVTGVTLNKTTATVGVGQTTTLVATASPADATDDSFTWSSSAPTVATVSAAGVVTGVAAGTATITAKANGASGVQATCEVTVTSAEVHEYVDLGLPSGKLWAKMNIGATSITDYGDYFAWGETTGYKDGKTNFTTDTYKYYNKTTSKDQEGFVATTEGYTKYITSGNATQGYNGFYDNKTTLDAEDDAATANWGDGWHMPTHADFQELKDNCTWTWGTLNGVYGYKVMGSNNNYIFLPAAGYRSDLYLSYVGSDGCYWSSELYSNEQNRAWLLYFNSSNIYASNTCDRYYGQPVRAVRSASASTVSVTSVSLNKTTTSIAVGATETLTATVSPSNATNQNVTWKSSKKSVATVDANGKVTGVSEGTATITVTTVDGSKTATCTVTVTAAPAHEYVDLGLPSGTLWATCNIGANLPEEYGDYFAWGETEPQADNAYNWASYKWCNGAKDKLTKYCNNSSSGNEGFTDAKTVLDAEDDAATVNWGSEWSMPTADQMAELCTYCTWTWSDDYDGSGVPGFIVSSSEAGNTNSIFLPCTGYYNNGTNKSAGTYGDYWSRSLGISDMSRARYLYFKEGSMYNGNNNRYSGCPVRPVRTASVASVSLNKTATSIAVGATDTLTATIAPSNATNMNVTWSSSDISVATVDSVGTVTGVAAGTATITVTTVDGSKTATCAVTVTEAPANSSLLSGQFSVSATKQVEFTKGNLYWDGNDYKFEANQYDYDQGTPSGETTTFTSTHVSHFFWAKTASVAYAETYSDETESTSDKFFCGEVNKIAVEGTVGFYALSCEEWVYLLNTRTVNGGTGEGYSWKKGVTVADKANCLIIAPDGYTGSIASSYDATAWAAAEADGLVCLPAAGYRDGSGLYFGGSYGYYWSSFPDPGLANYAYGMLFEPDNVYPASTNLRDRGFSLRLVKTVE